MRLPNRSYAACINRPEGPLSKKGIILLTQAAAPDAGCNDHNGDP